MDWARRRQLIVLGIFAAIFIVLAASVAFAVIYKVPTCSDRTQNQGESGVDCGGPCSAVCTAEARAPQVRFVRAVTPEPGRTDVIAYVDNPNATAAAIRVRGTIELYDADHVLVAKQDVLFDLPPLSTVPVFLPRAVLGDHPVTQAFLTVDADSLRWFQSPIRPVLPTVSDRTIDPSSTRITALLNNATAEPLNNLTVIAVVFDGQDNAIAASRTIVPELPPQGSAPLVFTWNVPFAGTAARVEIVPVVGVRPGV